MPVAEPYQEFAERWGNDEFGKYCQLLQQHADIALQQADKVKNSFTRQHSGLQCFVLLTLDAHVRLPSLQAVCETASDACGQVAEHEKAFWQMAYSA